jgi:hypothetical protein
MRLHEIAKAIGHRQPKFAIFPSPQSRAEPKVIAIGDCDLHLFVPVLTRSFKFLKGFTGQERNGTSGRGVGGMD